MNSFPRLLSGLGRKDVAWVCSSCAKRTRQRPSTPFFKPSMRRHISESSKPRQNAVPTMEQLRAPFQKKNSTTMYYTISIILGTVAFSYGSVPMYKMVRHHPPHHEHQLTAPDLPNHRFWRTTYKSTRARWS
jgi:cytochrome c oxidase assembly protein subunit 11